MVSRLKSAASVKKVSHENVEALLLGPPFFLLFACYHRTERRELSQGWLSLRFFGDCLLKIAGHPAQERIAICLSILARLLVEINKQSLVTVCFERAELQVNAKSMR